MRLSLPRVLAALVGFAGHPVTVSAGATPRCAVDAATRRLGTGEIQALFSGMRVVDRAGSIAFEFRSDGAVRILHPSPLTPDGNGTSRVGAPRWFVRYDEMCIAGRTQSSVLCYRVLQAADQVSMQVVSTSGAERPPFQVSIEAIPRR